jgi:hypothetical protein
VTRATAQVLMLLGYYHVAVALVWMSHEYLLRWDVWRGHEIVRR